MVQQAAFGRILLGLLGIGMICFAIYCLLEAAYRVIPGLADDDKVMTMARRAELEARGALS